jgi:hypothetical protein
MNTTPQYKNICLAQQQKDQLYFSVSPKRVIFNWIGSRYTILPKHMSRIIDSCGTVAR